MRNTIRKLNVKCGVVPRFNYCEGAIVSFIPLLEYYEHNYDVAHFAKKTRLYGKNRLSMVNFLYCRDYFCKELILDNLEHAHLYVYNKIISRHRPI